MTIARNHISRRCTVVAWSLVAVLVGCTAEAPDDPSGDRPGAGLQDDESLLMVLRTRFDGPDRDRDPRQVFEYLDGGRLSLRRFGEVPVSDGVPWHGAWAEGVNTSHLRVLHSLLIVNDLVAVEAPEALALAEEHVLDWRDANPPEAPAHPMAWHDETTARRTLALVQLHDAKVERGVADEWNQRALRELITRHIELLASDEFHSTGTNHGMFQDRSLLVATAYLRARGLRLPGVGDDYESLAATRLMAYYREAVGPDGVHREHAPAYHQLIASSAKSDAALLDELGAQGAADQLRRLSASMVHYATHVIQPDGTWPLVSDTFPSDHPANELWDDPGYEFATTGSGAPPRDRAVAFPEGGYVIARDRWSHDDSGTYIHFTAAYHGNYHKHADDLSLWVYHDGPLLTEMGPQGYEMDDPLVSCAFSELAHNTVTIVEQPLPRTDDHLGATELVSSDVNQPPWSATGRNDRLEGTTIERSFTFDPDGRSLKVEDRVDSVAPVTVRIRWHVDPSVEVTTQGQHATLSRPGLPPVTATFASDVALTVSTVRDDAEACGGVRLGGGDPTPATTIELLTSTVGRTATIVHEFDLPAADG